MVEVSRKLLSCQGSSVLQKYCESSATIKQCETVKYYQLVYTFALIRVRHIILPYY